MTSSRASHRYLVLPLLLMLVFAVAAPGFAQSRTGTLAGTVVDVSGAILAGADVVLTNESSKDVRRTKTNSDGFFSFAAVPNGSYGVSVESPGFAKFERKGIVMGLGDNRTLGTLKLDVAGVQTEITVAAVADIAPSSSGEKSATITAEQIENITIVGRSAAELLKLLPGLTPLLQADNKGGYSGEVIGINGNGEGGRQSAIGNFSGNGTRTDALDITIDGAPGADPGCNCATPVNPNKEFVEEFKVLQSNFGAEHAKGPVTMNVVSKSGGREFHGSLYSYVRDYHLNANEWQNNKVGNPRVENKFFFPGGTLSGPLLIPGTGYNKERDKAFFFVGFEYMKQRLDTGILRSYVPTDAMRAGDFSQAASLGLGGSSINGVPTGTGINGGVLSPGVIDPGGQAMINLLPRANVDPNVANGYNYQQQIPVDQNGTQLLARIDFNISDSTKLFVRYNRQRETQPFPVGLWWRNPDQVPYPSAVTAPNQSDSATMSLTNVFSPTLTNEAIFGATYINFPNQYADPSKVSRSANGYPYQGIFKESNDQIPAVTSWGGSPTMLNPGGFDPILYAKKWQISFSDNLTKVTGAHTMKFGAYYEWVQNAQPGNDYSNGLIINAPWAGGSSGNAVADLMMGRALGGYQESTRNPVLNEKYQQFEAYAQDSFRVKPRLTVDYGIRFGYLGPWYDGEGNGMVVFDPAQYNSNASITDRSGLTYNKINSSVPLSGINTKNAFFSPRLGFAWDVKGTGDTLIRGGVGMFRYHDPQNPAASTLSASTDFVSTSVNGLTLSQLETFSPGTAKPNINSWSTEKDNDQQPLTYSWSLTLQQRLPWSLVLETAYVGNESKYLPDSGGLANLNYVPFGAMLNDPNGDQNSFRPYQNYGTIAWIGHSHYQNYHGWQTLLARQRGRVNFTAAYTFSKNLGIRGGGNGDTGNTGVNSPELGIRNTNYGALSTDRTHVFNLGYSIHLPDVKKGGVMQGIFGGWQVSGVTTFISGSALQASQQNLNIQGTTADGTTISNTVITGTPDIAAMAVITCDPTKGVPDGYMFNPACFGAPSVGANGNYVIPTIRGPWYQNHNLSIFKNFGLGSSGRQKLQFRMEAYNFLNHPLQTYDTNNNLTARFTNGVLSDPNFGKLPEDNKFGRRIVQLALRYSF